MKDHQALTHCHHCLVRPHHWSIPGPSSPNHCYCCLVTLPRYWSIPVTINCPIHCHRCLVIPSHWSIPGPSSPTHSHCYLVRPHHWSIPGPSSPTYSHCCKGNTPLLVHSRTIKPYSQPLLSGKTNVIGPFRVMSSCSHCCLVKTRSLVHSRTIKSLLTAPCVMSKTPPSGQAIITATPSLVSFQDHQVLLTSTVIW